MYTYIPQGEDPFESLKTFQFDESQLEPWTTLNSGIYSPRYGIKCTEEQRQRMSEAQKNSPNHATRGKKRPEFAKNRTGSKNPMYGVPSPFTGRKHELLTCPHCGKVGGKNGMIQWHFDNCKFKEGV